MRSRIGALFTDIDGTLIPPTVKREEARLDEEIKDKLMKLSERIKIAAITTKDYSFARRILPFAHAWAVVGGIEIVTRDGRRFLEEVAKDLREEIKQITRMAEEKSGEYGITVEKKMLSDGVNLAGICLDWRYSEKREEAERFSKELAKHASGIGLNAILYPSRPYVDIYVGRIDKGRALDKLRHILKVDGQIVYLGDSEADNPAFREADISVGIIHDESPRGIEAERLIRFHELRDLLEDILQQVLAKGDRGDEGN